jgi:hypothetical protein
MAPKASRSKKTAAKGSCSQEPFLPFKVAGGGSGLEQLIGYVADESNKNGPIVMAHAREDTSHGARDARVFLCFFVEGMIPPMSLFLHAVLTAYGMVLAHLHPNSLLVLAIFQHLCEAYVRVHPSVALFRVFYDVHLDDSGAISGRLIFRLRPHMVARYIAMSWRTWEEWRANWCFLEFSEADNPVAYAEPTAPPEALQI